MRLWSTEFLSTSTVGGYAFSFTSHPYLMQDGIQKFLFVWCRGSQPFSKHVPFQHFDKWAFTPKIPYDKKAE